MSHFKNQGYILLTVIIFLQIVSSLSLCELFILVKTLRVNQHRLLQKSLLIKSKTLLRTIEFEALHYPARCAVPILSNKDIRKKPLSWWQLKGCALHLQNVYGYFILERLGVDHCSYFGKNSNNQIINAEYYRITLYSYLPKKSELRLILQSSLAKPSDDHLSCTGKLHWVLPGRQMLREL